MAQQQMLNIPLVEVAGYSFNPAAMVAIDRSVYDSQKPDRCIVLYLIGEIDHEFEGERADEFNRWYLSCYGRTSLQSVT